MDAKLIIGSSPTTTGGFKNNVLWGNPKFFSVVLWLNVELTRPLIDTFQEVDENQLKDRIITYQRQRASVSFFFELRAALVDFFSKVGMKDSVVLQLLETGEIFTLSNVRFEDGGTLGEVVGVCSFTFDMNSVTASNCGDTTLVLTPC